MTTPLNTAFLKLSRRAETYERSHLVLTFVDVGPLFILLSNKDHQILYGRRGTGKTHALYYLSDYIESKGDISIMIDMRTVGSTGGIYSDPTIQIPERATRLLVDTLSSIHDKLLNFVIENDDRIDLSEVGPLLDKLAEAITEVIVSGSVEQEITSSSRSQFQNGVSTELTLSTNPSARLGLQLNEQQEESSTQRSIRRGNERHRVHFGSVCNVLSEVIQKILPMNLWILLDEWSEVPLDLQPYLADLLRRTIFPIAGITVKIAAIEQRCQFRLGLEGSHYIGIEVGADAATSLNLDEFMVFDNNAERAKDFFSELLFRHVRPVLDEATLSEIQTSSDLIRHAFNQRNAFEEFVRAAEGVPRDAINILVIAAQRANINPINVQDIRVSAKTWYNRAKESAVNAKPGALDLLRWIVDEVVGHRRARAFLLRSDVRHQLIDYLFDARLLHVVKHNISAHDQPGVRFNVYSIDYGCYVDLINTSRAPQGLYEIENSDGIEYVQVPANDYRSIRRAILQLERFEESLH
ncbi:MAG: hypothetical protein NC238_09035 [Dehalobacter sp.]|nr:hypothetical protein [Dehalobacter sp.]